MFLSCRWCILYLLIIGITLIIFVDVIFPVLKYYINFGKLTTTTHLVTKNRIRGTYGKHNLLHPHWPLLQGESLEQLQKSKFSSFSGITNSFSLEKHGTKLSSFSLLIHPSRLGKVTWSAALQTAAWYSGRFTFS